ncbi:HNH endonuclease signature motif containing protein [uncultured Dietzia sp.]|uniref:HNH endonuclease n=2 Tax=Dietzia TaxID=37914 RepID=UPI002609790A|nr:HNH endonuclease signature motif containing protein [uncultured Dietzia sp.]HMT49091.1 DUF222 domain-containing protein [Dietzia sp.]
MATAGTTAGRTAGVAAAGRAAMEALRAENRAAAARVRACHELLDLCEEEQLVRDLEAGYYDPDGPERPRDHAVLDPFDVACAEVVAVYGAHHNRASAMLTQARTLVLSFPGIVEAMEDGLLDEATATLLTRHMRTVDPSVLDNVHRLVVDWLVASIESGDRPGRNAILSMTDKIIASFDPAGVLARCRAAVRERRVRVRRGVDGMADLHALLSSTEAEAIRKTLDATARDVAERERAARVEAARRSADPSADYSDPTTLDERRADALVEAVLGSTPLGSTAPGTTAPGTTAPSDEGEGAGEAKGEQQQANPGPQIRLNVTVLAPSGPGDEPEVYLPRGGPATIDALIALLARSVGATITVPNPEPGSADSAQGRSRYRISAELARAVRLRDGTCRHPGCSVPAEDCDVDHCRPFDHGDPARGGQTEERNLMCLCRRHHRFKTFHEWFYQLDRDGTLTVITDSGHTITTLPDGPLARWRRRTGQDGGPGTTDVDLSALMRPWLHPRPLSTHWFRRACRLAAERRSNIESARADISDDIPDDDPPPF